MNKMIDRYRPVYNTPDPAGGGGTPPSPPAAPPSPPAAPPPGVPSWHYPTLPEETRQFLATAEYGKHETPEAALLHLHTLAKAQGDPKGYLPVPKGAEDQAAVDAIYKALGRPDAADKYDIKLPEAYTPNDQLMAFAKDVAFKLGADGAKAQALVDGFIGVEKQIIEKQVAEINAHNAAAIAALEKEFGPELKKAQADGARALEALKLPAETVAFFDQNKGSVHLARLLATIGKGMGEGSTSFSASTPGASAQNALAALNDFRASARYKEYEAAAAKGQLHPDRAAILTELEALAQKAYPSRRA